MHNQQQRPQQFVQQPSTMGLKSRRIGGNKSFYSVEPLPERATSVPLRQTAVAEATPHQQQGREGNHFNRNTHNSTASPADHIDRFFTSSNHPSMKGVGNWKKLLDTEKDRFHSVSTWGHLMLQKVVRETSNLPSPNPLRTAVSCMLLHRIAPLMGAGEDLMHQLLNEVFNSIYFSWGAYIDDKFTKGAGSGRDDVNNATEALEQEFDKALQVNSTELVDDPTALKFYVSSLNHRFTFFHLLDELQAARVKVVGLPSRVIVRCMNLWRHRIVLCIFTYWRGEMLRSSARKAKLTATVDTLFGRKSRRRIQDHLLAWRGYVVERRHRNIQDHENTQKKLQHRMGRHIQELETENATLKEQLSKLRTTHTAVVIQLSNMLSMMDKFHAAAAPSSDVGEVDEKALSILSVSDGPQALPFTPGATDFFGQGSALPEGAKLSDALGLGSSTIAGSAPVITFEQLGNTDEQRQNVASLFPEFAPPTQKRRTSDEQYISQEEVRAAESEADKAAAGPNRFVQLKDFLDKDPLAMTVTTPAPAAVAPHEASPTPAPLVGITSKATFAKAKLNYSDVLDWVSVRTQLMVMTIQPKSQGLRRCTNFTIDFRDSIRLACLVVSLGGDRSMIDDVASMADLFERAVLTLKAAKCFFSESDAEFWGDVCKVEAADITKAKGGKLARLVFGLYQKFHHLPMQTLPDGPPTDAIADALDKAGFAIPFAARSLAANSQEESHGTAEFSTMSPMHRSERYFGEFVEETIPDTQFATWFRELAASDSDDDPTNFFDVSLGGSVTGSVSEKMQRRMSRLSFRGNLPSSPNRPRSKKKSRNQELTESMVRWVRQKISLQHDGREVPNFSSMTGAEVLFCVLQTMFPKISLDSKDPLQRLKKMQECLSKRLHLSKITLGKELLRKRDRFASEDDVFVPMKELLLILFFLDQEVVVDM
jgi:hypothetical protein